MSGIESLIPLVNKLQDLFGKFEGLGQSFDLPQIAVVGEQSAGKSSVLENCVGKDFLPRGSGIVTRRPLILQLIQNKSEEYAEFLHCKGKKFTNFDMVRKEIEVETDRTTGNNKNISPLPINLSIYSPNVIDLTLIDLPGITKNPVGDQPQDIEIQIKKMILTFISQPSCLILAVTPATIDIANSEALKMAREVDPNGDRTIGVITKIDLMDQGTDCRDVLLNKVYPLKRGYIGIVNRSQKDINGNKNIKDAQEAEKRYFNSHEAYKDMTDSLGTLYLQKHLNIQLTAHIRKLLPEIKNNLKNKLTLLEPLVEAYKELDLDDPVKLTRLISATIQDISNSLERDFGNKIDDIDIAKLSGGARINKLFLEIFPIEIKRNCEEDTSLNKNIYIAIQNSCGFYNRLFSPYTAFVCMTKNQINKIRNIFLKMSNEVSDELYAIFLENTKMLSRYPLLLEEFVKLAENQLSLFKKESNSFINSYIDIELAYINMTHPDFLSTLVNLNKEKDVFKSETDLNLSLNSINLVRKGWLTISSIGLLRKSKEVYVVLKKSEMTFYKDEKEEIIRFTCSLKGLKFKTNKKNKCGFILYYDDKRNISVEFKVVEILSTEKEFDLWKEAMITCGIIEDRVSITENEHENLDFENIDKIRQVRSLYEAYMHIIRKNLQDHFPKICIHFIINKIRTWLTTEAFSMIVSKDLKELMKVNEYELEKMKKNYEMANSCILGLQMINKFIYEVNLDHRINNKYSIDHEAKSINVQGKKDSNYAVTEDAKSNLKEKYIGDSFLSNKEDDRANSSTKSIFPVRKDQPVFLRSNRPT